MPGSSCASTMPLGRRPVSSGSRPTALVIGLFALLSGFSLLLAGALLPDLHSLPAESAMTATARKAAAAFYAAEATALATGDASALHAAVAPAFVDHQPGVTPPRDRRGLVAEIAALRSARPGVRLRAEALLVDRDRVLAYVSMRPGDGAGSSGMPIAASDDSLELVRIAGGVVAERWSLDGTPGVWPAAVVAPTATPEWSTTRFATATAEGMVCGASHCS